MSRREAEVFLMSLLQMIAVWFLTFALTMSASSQITGSSTADTCSSFCRPSGRSVISEGKEHRHTYLRTGASLVDPVYKHCFNCGLVRRSTCRRRQRVARPGSSVENLPAVAVEAVD